MFETEYLTANFLPLPPLLIKLIGGGLFLFAGFIIFALLNQKKLFWCTVVIALDVLWVITVIPLALFLKDILGPEGIKLVMSINLVVAFMAILQFIALFSRRHLFEVHWPAFKKFVNLRKKR